MKVYGSFLIGLYHKEEFLDNVLINPSLDHLPFEPGKELRISNFSVSSDRCPPLVVLHMIAKEGVLFKLEPANRAIQTQKLELMHNMCLTESKVWFFSRVVQRVRKKENYTNIYQSLK